ncbi:amino acid ABC transporter permease [Naumannella halotolerans]|uniref:Glutamate transport system permease protein n=1 Tax=Naumannella halotolerans TaxID=993414 RepID=A0A4R7J9Y2_9ACTN|nr:amino acid ABC transporter permease [Naumannella halotolerans]TDT33189.1 glutamate transport system permease protein [Naumannella halotolerans]
MSRPVLFDEPGPKGRVINVVLGVVAVVLAVAVVASLLWLMRSQLGPSKWAPFAESDTWVYYVLPGLLNTLQAALLAVVLSLIFGVLLGMGRLSQLRAISVPCGIFVEFFRSVPVLVLMVFFYSMLGPLGILQGVYLPMAGVVLGLVFYNSTVIAELVRSGVHSLPRGQREAGLMVGLTEGQVLRSVLLPQAIASMLPALLNQLVVILKDTALGYIITYQELLQSMRIFATVQGNLVASFLVAAAIMIVLNFALTSIAQLIQKRLSRGRRSPTAGPIAPAAGVVADPAR